MRDEPAGDYAVIDQQLKPVFQALRAGMSRLYGDRLNRLILYGSRARGDAAPSSDIDVLVVLRGPVEPMREIEFTGDLITGIFFDYEQIVSCVFIAADKYESEGGPFLRNVRREGIPF